uniref:Putative ovule protein n=1 Tax=Solanum chacoense TaxID=4108 RepID=A0A0V0HGZ6_SOLCH
MYTLINFMYLSYIKLFASSLRTKVISSNVLAVAYLRNGFTSLVSFIPGLTVLLLHLYYKSLQPMFS